MGIGPVGGEALELADVHGLVHAAAAAAALAGVSTDTAADAGEGIVSQHDAGSAHVVAGGDEAHVAGDVDAGGAGVLAGAGDQLVADACGAALLDDVLFVLITEVLQSGQNGVGSGLAQAAHGGVLDDAAQVLQGLDVALLALACHDAVEDLQHALGAHTTCGTFAAGFLLDEVQVEAGGVHHAGVLVHDDQAAGAHDGAQSCQGFVVQGGVDVFSGDAAAGGAAGLGGLELIAVGDAAADGVDDLGQGGAHGDFHQAGVDDVAGQSEDLGAGALLGAELAEPVCAVEHDGGNGGQGLHVVDDGGLAEEAALEGEGGLLSGLAALTLNGCQQSGLFAADEGACADADLDVEIEAGAHDVLAQQAFLPGHPHGILQTVDGDGILGTDVDNAVVCADGVAADQHTFNDAVGVAFKDGTVHECTGVAFVGVADDVLFVAGLVVGSFPLDACGEACTAAATETGLLHLFDDFDAVALFQDTGQSQVAVLGHVAVDAVDVDEAAVAQGDTDLITEEGHVLDVGHTLLLDGVIEGVLIDGLAADEVLLHHVLDPLGGHFGVVGLVGQDVHDGAHGAGAHAAALDDGHAVGQAEGLQFLYHSVTDGLTAGGHAAGAVTYQGQIVVLTDLFLIGFLHGLKVSNASDHASAPPSMFSSASSYRDRMPLSLAGVTCL